jgi:segregation and condensation protein B
MLGTTREFLDYFGLKRLDDLPPLAELKEMYPEASPQSDLVDALQGVELGPVPVGDEEQALIVDDGFAADEWPDDAEEEEGEGAERPSLRLVIESEPH